MRFTTAVLLTLTACLLWAQTQIDQPPTGQPEGRIIGVVTYDDGEPVEWAILCTRIANPNGNSTSCGGTPSGAKGEFEIRSMPMGKISVYAQKEMGGYWQDQVPGTGYEATKLMKTVQLTPESPIARVVLKIGPKPAELIVNVTDRQTGKPVETFFVRWIADTSSACSGNGNFTGRGTSGVRVPIRAATDVIVEVSATGYKSWYFSDPSDPTRPVLRLESGEEKTLNAELEPDVTRSQPTQ
jgi:hypothetical protein